MREPAISIGTTWLKASRGWSSGWELPSSSNRKPCLPETDIVGPIVAKGEAELGVAGVTTLNPGYGKAAPSRGECRMRSRHYPPHTSQRLDVHGGVSLSDQWPIETEPPSLTLRRVSASGTMASEINISTQKASM